MAATAISVREFCTVHGVTHEYIYELRDFGLIQLQQEEFLQDSIVPKVEKIIRLRQDLNINLEGIEVIFNLLDRVTEMDNEVVRLRNRLKLYED